MNVTLAVLLADAVHQWDAETPDSERRLDIVEAKEYLRAFTRLFSLEELAESLGKRLWDHDAGGHDMPSWAEITTAERNNYIRKAHDVLDAFRDELTEDAFGDPVERALGAVLDDDDATLDRVLDRSSAMSAGICECVWCGRPIRKLPGADSIWMAWETLDPSLCPMAPDHLHAPVEVT